MNHDMADTLKADVKLSPPVVMSSDAYPNQFTELAGRIVKIENGKLYLMSSSNSGYYWIEVFNDKP